jgi:hypothetical protein
MKRASARALASGGRATRFRREDAAWGRPCLPQVQAPLRRHSQVLPARVRGRGFSRARASHAESALSPRRAVHLRSSASRRVRGHAASARRCGERARGERAKGNSTASVFTFCPRYSGRRCRRHLSHFCPRSPPWRGQLRRKAKSLRRSRGGLAQSEVFGEAGVPD